MSSLRVRNSGDTLLVSLLATVSLATLALFSPFASFYTGIFFLLVCSEHINQTTIRWVGSVCAYSGSVMVASRQMFGSSDDFFTHYYATYTQILNGGWEAVFHTPYGYELGLPIYYYLLSGLNIANEIIPLFAVAMLASGLFVFWIDRHGRAYFPSARYGTVMATSLLLYSFLMASLVSRQMIALSFVLFAVSTTGRRSVIWLLGAVLFQQTALLIYLLFKYARNLNWISFALVIGASLVFVSFFNQAVELAASYNLGYVQLLNKLSYYTSYSESYTGPDLAGLKFILLCGAVALIAHRHMPENWGRLILLVVLLYVVLLPLPLASLRLFLIFVTVLAGYVASFMGFRIGWSATTWIVCAYALYKMNYELGGMDDGGFSLWEKFDWIGYSPLYYFAM
jgi:hypothetical protein